MPDLNKWKPQPIPNAAQAAANSAAARAKAAQMELDRRAQYLRNQATTWKPPLNKWEQQPTTAATPAMTPVSFPSMPIPPIPQAPGGAGGNGASSPVGSTGSSTNAQLYQPLLDLQNESRRYREDLRNGTGRIAGQIAGATGDWLAGMQEGNLKDAAVRGIGGSGVEGQIRQASRDTATRAGAKQLGDLAVQREAMLGGAIQGALPGTTAAPELALREKQTTMQGQTNQQNLAQQQYQNQLQASNMAFNQYMAMLDQQRNNQAYTGFRL